MTKASDLYEVLGVDRTASTDDVRKAYRRKAKSTHPDVPGGSPERFQSVALAHRVLSDETSRAKYDATGSTEETTINEQRARALQIIASQIETFLTSPGAIYRKLVDEMRIQLDRLIVDDRRQRRSIEEGIAAVEKLRARFKAKKGADVIGGMLDTKIADARKVLGQIDDHIAVLALAKTIIEDAEFVPEAEPTAFAAYGFRMTTTSSGTSTT